jgi:type II secretory pathway pseudopilin PulG
MRMQKLRTRQDGMSLVEATIILMIIFLLTAVLSPTISDYVADARQTKGKEDVEAIGTAILRLIRDTGLPFPVQNPTVGATVRNAANRIDVLISDGNTPSTVANTNVAANDSAVAGYRISAARDWTDTNTTNTDGVANMNYHLAYNTTSGSDPAGNEATDSLTNPYPLVVFPAAGGPRVGLGWRGAYLTGPIGPDPWGNRYAANTVFLNPSADSFVQGTNFDAFVISAGSDGTISTDIEGNGSSSGGTSAGGDDLIYIMTGTTR